jgi:hypothetical protein
MKEGGEYRYGPSVGYDMVPQTLAAELLDNVEPDTDNVFRSYEEFILFKAKRLTEGGRKLTVTQAIAPPVWGKSNLIEQDIACLVSEATGDPNPDLKKNRLQTKDGEPLVIYNLSWGDVVKQTRNLGLIPPLEFGQWKPEHTHTITQVAQQAIDIARNGIPGDKVLPGIDEKNIGIIGIDVAAVTATANNSPREGEPQYLGHDRFFTAMRGMAKDNELKERVYQTIVYTDAKSQERRLIARESLQQVKSQRQMRRWLKASGIRANENRVEAMSKYLPTSSASLAAATEIAKQASELMLRLRDDSEIQLNPLEQSVLEAEIDRINQGYKLIHRPVAQLQSRKIRLMVRELLPHIEESIGLPKEQTFKGWNKQLSHVTIYPAIPLERNLIARIADKNSKLLIPSQLSSEVYF